MQSSQMKSINDEIQSGNYNFILSHIPQNPPLMLTKRSFDHLNSAISDPKISFSDIYCITLIYLVYLNQPQLEIPIVPAEIASNLYILLEKTQGSLLNSQLLNQLIFYLRQTITLISSSSTNESEELLQNLNDDILGISKKLIFPKELLKEDDPLVNNINVLAQKDKPLALMEYLEYLCTGHSIEEQLLMISKYSNPFFERILKPKSLNPYFHDTSITSITSNPKDLFLSLHRFLDTVIFQYRYSIILPKENSQEDFTIITINQQVSNNQHKTEDFSRISSSNQSEEPRIFTYEDLHIKSLLRRFPVYENFEPLLDFLLRNMVLSRESISQEMKLEFIKFLISIILDRLWDIYPQYQTNMKMRLQAIFKELDRENLHICQLQAGFLLYEKIKKKKLRLNEFLNELLNENPQIRNSVESFQKESHKYYRGPGSLKELILKENCPLNQHIPAGGVFSRNIEIMTPGTIIYWVFATRTLDIEFQVDYLGPFGGNFEKNEKFPQILIEKKRLDTGKKVQRGLILAKKTGLFRFSWDNRYSWFTEKLLRYRIFVLEVEENEENEMLGKSPYAIFNSCRDILGLEEENPFRKNSHEKISSQKNLNKQRVKETLETVYKWKGNLRIIILLKEKSLEIKGWSPQKTFELLREFEFYSQETFQESLTEVLNKISNQEFQEDPEILFLTNSNTKVISNLNFSQTIMSFSKVYMHNLLRKFVEIGGNISGMSRKPIPFSRILLLSLIHGNLTINAFNDLNHNFSDCLINNEKSYFQVFQEHKNPEISLKCLVNALILLKFKPQKIIINRNGLFSENFTQENLRKDIFAILQETLETNERDIETLLLKNNIDLEMFSYEFKLDSLLK